MKTLELALALNTTFFMMDSQLNSFPFSTKTYIIRTVRGSKSVKQRWIVQSIG